MNLLNTPVVFLRTVSITEMAEVVVPAQVFKQLVVIEVSVITELAERVSSVACVIWVSMRSVACQFLSVVPLALIGKDLVGKVKFKEHVSDSTVILILCNFLGGTLQSACTHNIRNTSREK